MQLSSKRDWYVDLDGAVQGALRFDFYVDLVRRAPRDASIRCWRPVFGSWMPITSDLPSLLVLNPAISEIERNRARYRAVRKEIETLENSIRRRRVTRQECYNDLQRLQHETIRLDDIQSRIKIERIPEFKLSASEANALGIAARDYEVFEAVTVPTSILERAWDEYGFTVDFLRTIAESPNLSDVVRSAVGSS